MYHYCSIIQFSNYDTLHGITQYAYWVEILIMTI